MSRANEPSSLNILYICAHQATKPGRSWLKNFTCDYLGEDPVSSVFSVMSFGVYKTCFTLIISNSNSHLLHMVLLLSGPTAHHLLPGHADDQWWAPEAAAGPVLLWMWLFPMPNPGQGTLCGTSLNRLPGTIPMIFQRTLFLFHPSKSRWLSVHSRKQK